MEYFFTTNNPLYSSKAAIYSKRTSKNSKHRRNYSVEMSLNDDIDNCFVEPNVTNNTFYLPQSFSNAVSISINSRRSSCTSKAKREQYKAQNNFINAFSSYRNANDLELEENNKEKEKRNEAVASERSVSRGSRSLQPLKSRSNNQSANSTTAKFPSVRLGNEAKIELKKIDKLEYKFDFKRTMPPKMNLEEYLEKLKDRDSGNKSSKNQYLTHSFQNGRHSSNKKRSKQMQDFHSDMSTNLQLIKAFPEKSRIDASHHKNSPSSSIQKINQSREEDANRMRVLQIKRVVESGRFVENNSLISSAFSHERLAKKYNKESEQLKQSIQKDIKIFNDRILENSRMTNFDNFLTPTIGEIDP